MSDLAVIHFNNIEKYPPGLNLIQYFKDKEYFESIHVFSRTDMNSKESKVKYHNGINVVSGNILIRLWGYLYFYLSTIVSLIKLKPKVIIYYESLSYLPVFLYKRFNSKVQVFCHYHEYETKEQYKSGMFLNRLNHSLEIKDYNSFKWISHTNAYRMEFFLKDYPFINLSVCKIMPNYPPLNWYTNIERVRKPTKYPIHIVYAGALGFEDMYIKEFATWVIQQEGKAILHIYSLNTETDVKVYLENLKTDLIQFKGAMNYFELPNVLRKYDVGVILYKGNTTNYIYNEPNKFFEYYACGLDVWFPLEMLAMKPYINKDVLPSILELDFNELLPLESYCSNAAKWDHKTYARDIAFSEILDSISIL